MALYRAQAVIAREGLGEDVATNTFGISTSAPGIVVQDAIDVAAEVFQLYTASAGLLAFMHSSHELERVKVYDAEGGGDPLADFIAGNPGVDTGSVCPLQVSATLTFRTAVRKRWGRIYLPGIATSRITSEGLLSQSTVEGLADVISAWNTQLPASMSHCVLSAPTATSDADLVVITEYQVDNVPDIIRKRRAESGIVRARRTVG